MTATASPSLKTYKNLDEFLADTPAARKWAHVPEIKNADDYVRAVLTTESTPQYQRAEVWTNPADKSVPPAVEALPWHFRFNHASDGLVSEQSELFDPIWEVLDNPAAGFRFDRINLGEELGDRFWYHALSSAALHDAVNFFDPALTDTNTLGWHLSNALLGKNVNSYLSQLPVAKLIREIIRADSKLKDKNKRLMQYGKKPPLDELQAASRASIISTANMATFLGFSELAIMRANIAKLYRRKLNAEMQGTSIGDMQGRDLAAEKAILASALAA
jgi:hypothetical protein